MYTWRNFGTVKSLREIEDVRDTTSYAIQSQYSASDKILALADGFQRRIDPFVDVELFYEKMFDIYTAEGFGLDNWGVILQIGRTIEGPLLDDSFGFNGTGLRPFNQAPFVPDISLIPPSVITLDDEHFRLLLLYKALANISAADAETQNKLLSVLIDTGIGGFNGIAYVLEVDVMVIRWVFEDFLTPVQLAVFRAAGTLARGAGVGWELYAVNPSLVFGYDGTEEFGPTGMHPFVQAPFAPDKALVIYMA